jgi:hypothetical protein
VDSVKRAADLVLDAPHGAGIVELLDGPVFAGISAPTRCQRSQPGRALAHGAFDRASRSVLFVRIVTFCTFGCGGPVRRAWLLDEAGPGDQRETRPARGEVSKPTADGFHAAVRLY